MKIETHRATGLQFVRFPAKQLGVYLDSAGLPLNRARPHTAAEVLDLCPAAEAVLDGPMFHVADRYANYETYKVGVLDYRYIDTQDGDTADGGALTDRKGCTLSIVPPGVSLWFDGDHVAPGALAAVQFYPALVRAGRVVASAQVNRSKVWRAGIGSINEDVVFAVGVATMSDFAHWMLLLGCTEAGYTDGGGSARLAVREQGVPSAGSRENRRVPSWLTCEPSRGI